MSPVPLWMSDSFQLCPEYEVSSLPISCSILTLPGEDFLTTVSWKIGSCLYVGYSGLAPIHRLGKGIVSRLHVYILSKSGLLSSTAQKPELTFVNTGHLKHCSRLYFEYLISIYYGKYTKYTYLALSISHCLVFFSLSCLQSRIPYP